jgi:gluconate 2-dehydrogenase gamma chain
MAKSNEPKSYASESAGLRRRDLIQIIGGAPMLAAATAGMAPAQEHEHKHHIPSAPPPFVRQVFDDHQWKLVQKLSDLIIPADQLGPSATEAEAPEYIDDWLQFRATEDGNDNLKAQVLGGLTWLDMESNRLFQKNFVDAAPEQQKQILDRIAYPGRATKDDARWASFFTTFRDLVASGYISSKAGMKYLPYLGNTAVAHWQGTDPKVWAVIEERMKNGYKGVGGEAKPWTTGTA